jgi:DNA polymerase elongation subunit (family B)
MMWEPEKIYDKFLQLGRKKRYAGNRNWKEGTYYEGPEISISGFENQRSDSMEVTAEMQENIIKMALTDSTFDDVSDYIQSTIDGIDESSDDVKKFALPGSINKDLKDYPNRQVPRACMWSNEHLDREFSEGDDPFVYLVKDTPSGLPNTDVLALEWNEQIPDGFRLDKEAIIERGIRKPIQSIIDELGWEFNELRSGRSVDESSMDLTSSGTNPFAK